MDEGDPGAARPDTRFFIDQPVSAVSQDFQRFFHVVDLKGDMVDALPALLDESGYRTLRVRRLKELHLGVARGQEGHGHAVAFHRLPALQRQPENLVVETERLIQIAHGDPDVRDAG